MDSIASHKPVNLTALPKAEYIKQCQRYAAEYSHNVLSHIVKTNEFIKLAVARGEADKQRADLFFDVEAVNRVYEFFSFLRISHKNKLVQFTLQPWQCWILQELFGYYYLDADGLPTERRYQISTLFVARKNGKTKYTAGIALYMFCYDREFSPEIYFAATTREQAGQMLDYCKELVIDSHTLRSRVKILQYSLRNQFRGIGKLKTVQSKAKRLDGLNPHFTCVDEYHAHPDDSMFNIFKTGMVQRENPMLMITSTAGVDKEGPFFNEVETGKKVLRGEATNDRYFYAFYMLDSEKEIEQPNEWVKANPNINVTVKLTTLVADYEAAKLSPTKMHNFIIKNLNLFQDQLIEQWIADSDYRECFKNPNVWQLRPRYDVASGTFVKLKAYMGLDISSTRDLSALVILVENPVTGQLEVIPEFYFPQNENKRVRGTNVDLREWIKQGHIIEMDTPTINQEHIIERVRHWSNYFEIVKIGYDEFNAGFMITKIEIMGIEATKCPQNAMFFNAPLKNIERLILMKTINMSRNPVLRWNFNNVVLYADGNGNIKVMKNKSRDSVDGPVALGMAMGVYMSMAKTEHLFKLYCKSA